MDNDFLLNYDDILRTIRTADVLTVRFVVISQRLLIDARTNEIDGPMIKVVARARNAEDRFRSLKQLRPRFRVPEKISAIWWPRYIQSLSTSGVWDALVSRMEASGFPQAVEQCEEVYIELLRLEREQVHNAITGEGFQALWECRSI
jgi:hypothetical protein